jgi:hypothetical protein
MAIVFEQIDVAVTEAPASTLPDQQKDAKNSIDPAEIRRTFEILQQRSSRLEAD